MRGTPENHRLFLQSAAGKTRQEINAGFVHDMMAHFNCLRSISLVVTSLKTKMITSRSSDMTIEGAVLPNN